MSTLTTLTKYNHQGMIQVTITTFIDKYYIYILHWNLDYGTMLQ